MAAILIPTIYDKEKKYHVDIEQTLNAAKNQLSKQNIKAIKLTAKGNDINKISLVGVRLQEQSQNKWKITEMKTEFITEKNEKDNLEKKHMYLNIVVQKKQK